MNTEYRKYLKSDDWQRKRRKKFGRNGGAKKRCAICASTERLDIHHLSYRRDLTRVRQCDLRVLCRACHDCAHELMRSGVLKFTSRDHHHRFTLTKTAVKKARGLNGNVFRERAREPEVLAKMSRELAAIEERYYVVSGTCDRGW